MSLLARINENLLPYSKIVLFESSQTPTIFSTPLQQQNENSVAKQPYGNNERLITNGNKLFN